ncbi:hypothetical protein Fot_24890 [Forsythia ovata]|uniref:Uncharacterized protein n=1 Tax=Forsythia ovata TaxID=205694 RepID=A0ABD1U7N3_9LAMI
MDFVRFTWIVCTNGCCTEHCVWDAVLRVDQKRCLENCLNNAAAVDADYVAGCRVRGSVFSFDNSWWRWNFGVADSGAELVCCCLGFWRGRRCVDGWWEAKN